jgi:hypothetical protein
MGKEATWRTAWRPWPRRWRSWTPQVVEGSEAELYGLKGELLWHTGNRPEEAEACFLHMRTIARRQQAKSWELRAALSLSRLWQRQGKLAEVHQLLAEVYAWFTEGRYGGPPGGQDAPGGAGEVMLQR